jgi:glutaredoxin 3
MQSKIVMYTTAWCPYCARARNLLTAKGVAFEEIDVDDRDGAREEMVTRSGGRHTVPQIFAGDIHIGGSDELQALDAAGKLDPLLEELTNDRNQ